MFVSHRWELFDFTYYAISWQYASFQHLLILIKWIQANAICLLKVIHWLIVDMQEYEKLHLNSKYGECIAIGSSFILYIYYIYFTKKNGILKRTTSDIFNVEKKTVHVPLNNYVHDISVLLGC